jgi:hypothetical protein
MKELGPTPVPLIVPGEAIAEEDVHFISDTYTVILQFGHCPVLLEEQKPLFLILTACLFCLHLLVFVFIGMQKSIFILL